MGDAGSAACLDEIRLYLSETFQIPPANLPDDAALLRGRLDSIGLLVLIAHIEEIYGITVAEEEVAPGNFGTLRDVAAFVTGKRAASGGGAGSGAAAADPSAPPAPPLSEGEVKPEP